MKKIAYEAFVRVARGALHDAPETEGAPYAFEKRVMAHVRAAMRGRAVDAWNLLAPMMWRAAFTCIAIALLTGLAVRYGSFPKNSELFAGDLERTVLAPMDVDEAW